MKSDRIKKHVTTGALYEVDYAVHSKDADGRDVVSGHKLSAYDGMPIGGRVWLPVEDLR